MNNTKITTCKVLVIGCGATGSVLLKQLVTAGFKNLFFADHDTIDLTNLNRQMYGHENIGRAKAVVLAEQLRKLVPPEELNIDFLQEKLEVPHEIFEWADIIVNCTDSLYHHGMVYEENKTALGKIYISPRMSGFAWEIFYCNPLNPYIYFITAEEEKKNRERAASSCTGSVDINPSIITTTSLLAALTAQAVIHASQGWAFVPMLKGDIKEIGGQKI